MNKRFLQFALSLFMVFRFNFSKAYTPTDTIFNRQTADSIFAFGADISWLTQQESWGTVYKDKYQLY